MSLDLFSDVNVNLLITTIGFSVSFLAMLILGVFVFVRGERKEVHVSFFILNLSLAVWTLVFIFGTNILNFKLAHLVWQFNVVVAIIGASYVHWVFAIINKAKEMRSRIITFYIISGAFVLSSVVFPDEFVGAVVPKMYFNNYATEPGIIYFLMVVYFMFIGLYALYHLIKTYSEEKSAEIGNRLKYVIAGSLLGWVVGPMAFFLVWDIQFDPILSMFIGFYNLIFAYAIFKHDLMDIRAVIKKAFFYSVALAIISALLISVSLLSNWLSENILGFKFWVVPLISSIVALTIGDIFWKKSQENERLKYEFLSVASHKLRTPLTYIRWEIANLFEDKDVVISDKVKETLDKINDANSKLIRISDIMLGASSQNKNKLSYKLSYISIGENLKNILSDFKKSIDEKNIKFSIDIDKNLPLVHADSDKITSVIRALVENAVIYTPKGGDISVSINAKGKNKVIFKVTDSGIGLTKRERRQVFSKFFRSHSALLVETEGLGVNLFIAKNIIDNHHGKIGVKSKGLEQGSTFWFVLGAI